MTGQFTGRHMAALMVAGFGIVIVVNLVMASYATSTFGGVVVENSYVASQKFNGWLDEAGRDRGLGWDIGMARGKAGQLIVSTRKVPAGATVSGTARHPLGVEPDRRFQFRNAGGGRFVSRESLPAGRWTVRLDVRAGGDSWRGERVVR